MEIIKKTILQALTTGITACTGTTGTCYVIIPDTGVTYNIGFGLNQVGQDLGFMDAVGDSVSGSTPTYSQATGSTNNSRVIEFKKYAINVPFNQQYIGGGNVNSDGVDYNESVSGVTMTYYIGGVKYVDDVSGGTTTFSYDINNDGNFINSSYIKNPNRETINTDMFKLDSNEILSYNYLPEEEQIVGDENLLEGLYNLRLPATVFGQLGIYTIYIKPKKVNSVIIDCSVLSSLPSVKGIVLDINDLPENLRANNALQGYRIEYVDSTNNTKIRNVVRYVVTSNKVVPVSENVGNTSQKAIRYRFDDTGSLLFIQLTPSSSSDVKPNATPFIGNPDQTIIISNTFFSPLVIEVDMVENTIDTLTNYVAGEQIKDVNNGLLTYYDKNRVIMKQFEIYEIKEETGNVPLYEVKENHPNIDETQNFDDITSEVN